MKQRQKIFNLSTKKYDRISCSYSDGSVFSSQANKCYALQVFFDLSEPFYFYTKTTTVNKATILGQAIQVAQTPTLTMELLGTNHSFNYISEVYIMRKEPTALPEPLMWTGSGPSPLCQFFGWCHHINLPCFCFLSYPLSCPQVNFLLLPLLFSTNNLFQVETLSPSTYSLFNNWST